MTDTTEFVEELCLNGGFHPALGALPTFKLNPQEEARRNRANPPDGPVEEDDGAFPGEKRLGDFI